MSDSAAPTRVVTRPAPYGRVLITGLTFGVLLMIPTALIYGVLRLVGVPFEASSPGQASPALVGWWQVLLAPVVAGLAGAALAGTFRTLYNGPRLAALVLGALTLLSCLAPVLQPAGVTTSTKVSLALLHLLVGGGLTWALSRAITSEDPPPGVIEAIDARHPGAGASRV